MNAAIRGTVSGFVDRYYHIACLRGQYISIFVLSRLVAYVLDRLFGSEIGSSSNLPSPKTSSFSCILFDTVYSASAFHSF
jgi:hypothetical protein